MPMVLLAGSPGTVSPFTCPTWIRGGGRIRPRAWSEQLGRGQVWRLRRQGVLDLNCTGKKFWLTVSLKVTSTCVFQSCNTKAAVFIEVRQPGNVHVCPNAPSTQTAINVHLTQNPIRSPTMTGKTSEVRHAHSPSASGHLAMLRKCQSQPSGLIK